MSQASRIKRGHFVGADYHQRLLADRGRVAAFRRAIDEMLPVLADLRRHLKPGGPSAASASCWPRCGSSPSSSWQWCGDLLRQDAVVARSAHSTDDPWG